MTFELGKEVHFNVTCFSLPQREQATAFNILTYKYQLIYPSRYYKHTRGNKHRACAFGKHRLFACKTGGGGNTQVSPTIPPGHKNKQKPSTTAFFNLPDEISKNL